MYILFQLYDGQSVQSINFGANILSEQKRTLDFWMFRFLQINILFSKRVYLMSYAEIAIQGSHVFCARKEERMFM